jgi:uncharacterized membrane protein
VSETTTTYLLIFTLAVGTYGTRIIGDVVLSRIPRLDPRAEAALDAVPAAVLGALVAPVVLATGVAETVAAALTVLAALRLSMVPTLVVAGVSVTALRALGL